MKKKQQKIGNYEKKINRELRCVRFPAMSMRTAASNTLDWY